MSPPKAISRPSTGPVRVGLIAGEGTLARVGRVIQHMSVGLIDEPLGLTLVADETADVSLLPCPPIEVLHYPAPRPWRFHSRVVEPLAPQLLESGVEVIHALDASAHGLTRAIAAAADLPYLLTVWGLSDIKHLSAVGPECRAVLAVSTAVQNALLAAHVVAPDLVHVIRPGVHQGPPRAVTEQPLDRSRSIITVGHFDQSGHFETVIRAFFELRQRGYDCVLFLLGEGPAEHRLRHLAGQLGLMHQVTFVDRLGAPQLPGIFSAADVFVYPRSQRQFEMELLEAMAAGVPVLVGDCCVGDFAHEGQTSLFYSPTDSADLFFKMRALLDDSAAAAALVERARRYLRENHSPARMVAATAELYRKFALSERTLKLA